MKKVLLSLVLAAAALPTMAADDPSLPGFVDVLVQITNDGRPVYTAMVLIPKNTEVVDDTLKTSTMLITCRRDVTVSPPPVYEEGVHLALRSAAWGNDVLVSAQYLVSVPHRDAEYSAFGESCNRLNVETMAHSGTSSAFVRPGEAMNIKNDDIKITLTVRSVHMSPPAGRVPGQFYHG